jgi:AcrR family transcriptional regulator
MTDDPIEDMGNAKAAAGDNLPSGTGAVAQRREQTRNAILEAAWTALARDGYEKITTRRIAKLAGVNVATLHYYFGSKEQLLSDATRFALKDTEYRMRRAMDEAQTATAGLKNLFAAIWEMVQEGPGILRYDLIIRGFRDEAARKDVLAIYASYRSVAEDLVERHLREGGTLTSGVTSSDFANYLMTAIDGVLLQHVLTGDAMAAQRALAMVMSHALSLLNAE